MKASPQNGRRALLEAPALILVTGVAGSGKTTLAKRLVEKVWAVYLEKDELQNPFSRSRTSHFYKRRIQRQSYKALWNLALANLKAGSLVIVDAPLVREMRTMSWRREMERLFGQEGFIILVIHCVAPPAELRRRLGRRAELRDKSILRDFDIFLDRQPPYVPIPWPNIIVETQSPIHAQIESASKFLSSHLQGGVLTSLAADSH